MATTREQIAMAIEHALAPLGYRIRESDGIKVWLYPDRDLARVLIEPVPVGERKEH